MSCGLVCLRVLRSLCDHCRLAKVGLNAALWRLSQFPVLVLLLSGGFIYLGSIHHPFGVSLPPIGDFFNPFHGFWQNAEGTSIATAESLHFDELEEEVNVVMDERLVPHVFANSLTDAFFVQGYNTPYI